MPIESVASPPFPYNAAIDTYRVPDIYAFWEANQPSVVPPNWETFYEDEHFHLLYSGHIQHNTKYTLDIEKGCHYYGRPVPVLNYCLDDISIIDIGGLYFIYAGEDSYDHGLLIARPEFTLEQVAEHISNRRLREVSAGYLKPVFGQWAPTTHFYCTWVWEMYCSGRNRWRELLERGGRVDPELLADDTLLAAVITPSSWKKHQPHQRR